MFLVKLTTATQIKFKNNNYEKIKQFSNLTRACLRTQCSCQFLTTDAVQRYEIATNNLI
jgi:hypothetical protein